MEGFGLMIEELGPGAVRIALRGELDLAHAYTFDEELRRVEEGRPTCVVLDLRELTFLDSTGLAPVSSPASSLVPHWAQKRASSGFCLPQAVQNGMDTPRRIDAQPSAEG